jgi:sec-independent protein translocase protein TatB
MFDIGATELLLIVVVAILVIGPKDMPLAMRTAGRWIGKIRRLSGHFRTGLDAMVREAELEDMEKKWKAQNEKVMREHPEGVPAQMEPTGAYPPEKAAELKRQAKERIAAKEAAAAAEANGAAAEDAARPADVTSPDKPDKAAEKPAADSA